MFYYFIKCLKQYADFKGRARRKEFWFFQLFCFLFGIGLLAVLFLVGMKPEAAEGVLNVLGIALLLPSLAVMVRRLHDTDRSGWWALLCLVPLLGGLVLLIFACLEGTRGSNRFGPDPKAETHLIE